MAYRNLQKHGSCRPRECHDLDASTSESEESDSSVEEQKVAGAMRCRSTERRPTKKPAIPPALYKGDFSPVTIPKEASLFAFHLICSGKVDAETGLLPDILTFTAREVRGSRFFQRFVVPRAPVANHIQKVTGIKVIDGHKGRKKMFINGVEKRMVTLSKAIKEFLEDFEKDGKQKKVVLIAHNEYDFPVLMASLSRLRMVEQFMSVVTALGDSVAIMQKVKPGLPALVSLLGEKTYRSCNGDVSMMVKKLLENNRITLTLLDNEELCFSPGAVIADNRYIKVQTENFPSLRPLCDKKIIKNNLGKKIAGSGLKYNHLLSTYKKGGEEALEELLTAEVAGKGPRVDDDKVQEAVQNLADYFDDHE